MSDDDEGRASEQQQRRGVSYDDDDEEQAMATMSEYWGFFGLVLVQRLRIGVFFFFFLINTILEFVLLLLCIDCIGVWFSLLYLPAT